MFERILQKQFAQRDTLLLLWSASFVLMMVHQQLLYLLVVRERFRTLTKLALCTATVAIASGWIGMQHFGGAGAVLGILIGEAINTAGVVLLCVREVTGGALRLTRRAAGSRPRLSAAR